MISDHYFKVFNLPGGTMSSCFLVSVKGCCDIVFKSNKRNILRDEVNFLKLYSDFDIVPNFLFNSPDFSMIAYEFIKGEVKNSIINKSNMLKFLVDNLICKYVEIDTNGWGRLSTPSVTWKEYLQTLKEESHILLNGFLHFKFPNIDEFIDKIINEIAIFNENKKPHLLHGDLGFYNAIFCDDVISGIIDPMPIYGLPIYDLVFAFLSTIDGLEELYILKIMDYLDFNSSFTTEYKIKEILFGLYFRMGRCIKHHPHDINIYISAFEFWKKQLDLSDC